MHCAQTTFVYVQQTEARLYAILTFDVLILLNDAYHRMDDSHFSKCYYEVSNVLTVVRISVQSKVYCNTCLDALNLWKYEQILRLRLVQGGDVTHTVLKNLLRLDSSRSLRRHLYRTFYIYINLSVSLFNCQLVTE